MKRLLIIGGAALCGHYAVVRYIETTPEAKAAVLAGKLPLGVGDAATKAFQNDWRVKYGPYLGAAAGAFIGWKVATYV